MSPKPSASVCCSVFWNKPAVSTFKSALRIGSVRSTTGSWDVDVGVSGNRGWRGATHPPTSQTDVIRNCSREFNKNDCSCGWTQPQLDTAGSAQVRLRRFKIQDSRKLYLSRGKLSCNSSKTKWERNTKVINNGKVINKQVTKYTECNPTGMRRLTSHRSFPLGLFVFFKFLTAPIASRTAKVSINWWQNNPLQDNWHDWQSAAKRAALWDADVASSTWRQR